MLALTVETNGVRSFHFILAAVCKRVRATAHFDCTEAEAPVQRKCYQNKTSGNKADMIR